MLRKNSALLFSTVWIQLSISLIAMGDWMEMAKVVGRKLVENGQERILQRLFDGVIFNFFLDSFDFKESHHHQLLHLVWRRFPRNGCPTGGQKTTISDSTQTDEVPSTQWIFSAKDQCKGFSAKDSGDSVQRGFTQWILFHSMDSQWILGIHSMDSVQRISAKDSVQRIQSVHQCKGFWDQKWRQSDLYLPVFSLNTGAFHFINEAKDIQLSDNG